MPHINIEIKARCENPGRVKMILQEQNAKYKGADHQIDIYFNVPNGRLKLRKGNIENALIYYNRENKIGLKKSEIMMVNTPKNTKLEKILGESLGILAVVSKKRDIYYIGNVKFHVDEVVGLGNFVEIEAIDKDGRVNEETLRNLCNFYVSLLGIKHSDFVAESYGDIIITGLG